MSRKILVIGGNKFFGRRLVNLLIDRGDHVTLLNRGLHSDDFGPKVNRIVCDRRNPTALAAALKGYSWDVIYDQVCFDAHAAQEACELILDTTNHYIFTSSKFVYPMGPNLSEADFQAGKLKLDEIVTKEQDYALAKRQCEHVFFAHAPDRVCAVRLPIVVGPDDYTHRLEFYVNKIISGDAFWVPNLGARISLIHSADAAAGLLHIGSIKFQGAINLAPVLPIAISSLIAEIEKLTGRTANIRADGERSPYGFSEDWYMNVSRAKEIGFEARPILEWLGTTVQQIIANK